MLQNFKKRNKNILRKLIINQKYENNEIMK